MFQCFKFPNYFIRNLGDSSGSCNGSGSTTSTEDFIIIDLLKQQNDLLKQQGEQEKIDEKNVEENYHLAATIGKENFWYKGQETTDIIPKSNYDTVFHGDNVDVYY